MTFYVLGSHPKLSQAELFLAYPNASHVVISEEIVCLEDGPTAREALGRLAGTVKAGTIWQTLAGWKKDEAAALVASMLQGEGGEGKIHVGVSIYDGGDKEMAALLSRERRAFGITIKRALEPYDRSVRFVDGKTRALPSVAVTTNKLLTGGAEIILITTPEGIHVGTTEAVQDFEGWSDRDYGRPARDTASGMLPPKLARAMVNLSGFDPSKSAILDPFCGSGTVMMEAVFMGGTRIEGRDVSQKAVDDSKTNLAWLKKKYRTADVEIPVHLQDARYLAGDAQTFDCIVAETYLGPAQHGDEAAAWVARVRSDLLDLYKEAFSSLAKQLTKDGRMVIAFPVFHKNHRADYLPLAPLLVAAGLAILPFPVKAETPNGGLLYERKGQQVGREILLLKRK